MRLMSTGLPPKKKETKQYPYLGRERRKFSPMSNYLAKDLIFQLSKLQSYLDLQLPLDCTFNKSDVASVLAQISQLRSSLITLATALSTDYQTTYGHGPSWGLTLKKVLEVKSKLDCAKSVSQSKDPDLHFVPFADSYLKSSPVKSNKKKVISKKSKPRNKSQSKIQ